MKNNHLFKVIGLLLTMLIMPLYVGAQSISVSGTVKDVAGEPLIGVNVLEDGTTNGVITDIDGNYTLNVASNAKLTFSFVGYASQTVSVNGKFRNGISYVILTHGIS